MSQLSVSASMRIQKAFRPKTQRCYSLLFSTFLAFGLHMNIELAQLKIEYILSFLECMVVQNVSEHLLINYVSAIKAKLIVYSLDHSLLKHHRVRYFLKSVHINRPLSIPSRNIMDLQTFRRLISLCDTITMGFVYKAVFLLGYLGFLGLSNIARHSAASFDATRHLTPGHVQFTSQFVKITLTWSKTMQDRGKLHVLSLPRIPASHLCPYKAIKKVLRYFPHVPKIHYFKLSPLQVQKLS